MNGVYMDRRAVIHGVECVLVSTFVARRLTEINGSVCSRCPHSVEKENTCGKRDLGGKDSCEPIDLQSVVWMPLNELLLCRLQGKLK